jgi:hypothetical protein
MNIVIHAFWDNDAGVWVAESEQVPGLVAEAATPRELDAKLKVLVPELLELNSPSAIAGTLSIVAHFEHEARIALAPA